MAQLNSHAGYQELAILPGQHASSLALAREAAPHFGLSAARADQMIQAIVETVRRNAYLSVKTAGGNDVFTRRFKAFIETRIERIGF